jgi:hypothetical protein
VIVLPRPNSSFTSLRKPNALYFDRTEPLARLAAAAAPVLVCRPGGFGKTVACSALACLLEGRRELFEGLWAAGADWSWEPHEVVRLTLTPAGKPPDSPDSGEPPWRRRQAQLIGRLTAPVDAAAAKAGLEPEGDGPGPRLRHLMTRLHQRNGRRVAVIIDDVDAPLWPLLGEPESKWAMSALGGLLSVLEGPESWRGPVLLASTLRLPFEPGPGRPGLASLRDATDDPAMARFGGLSAEEIAALVAERPPLPARLLQSRGEEAGADPAALIMERYGGHSWGGGPVLANVRQTLGHLRSLFDGQEVSAEAGRKRAEAPIEPKLAKSLAAALHLMTPVPYEDSGGRVGLTVLQAPPAPEGDRPALDPDCPDPVALAHQAGLLAGKSQSGAAGAAPMAVLAPPNFECLALLARLGLHRLLRPNTPDTAARTADLAAALEGADPAAIEEALAGCGLAWSGESSIDPLEWRQFLLTLALAGRRFVARGWFGTSELHFRFEAADGSLILIGATHHRGWKCGGDRYFEDEFYQRRISRCRRDVMKVLDDAIRADGLRRAGRRIMKIAVVDEAYCANNVFVVPDIAPHPNKRGG